MAAILGKCLRPALCVNNSLSSGFVKECSPRLYTVFAPDFKDSIIDREEIKKKLEAEPKEKLLVTRIKPASGVISPCSAFYHPDVEKFTGFILRKGKRELARTLVEDAFTRIKHIQIRKYNEEKDENKKKDIIINPLEVFLLAVKNVTPLLWYVKIKRSGSWYRVPIGINSTDARKKGMKWIVECVKLRTQKISFSAQLANELLAASQYEGKAVGKKLELHKMCEANRGFAHYWWT